MSNLALMLEDATWMAPMPDDAKEEKFLRLTPGESKGMAEARAYLRQHIDDLDGAVDGAIAELEALGLSHADAREKVKDAKADIERQLAERKTDRDHDPVNAAQAEARSDGPVPNMLDEVYDERLVDDNGFILEPGDATDLYREYGINPDDDNAYKLMQLEIRDQIFRNLNDRMNYVVLDGEAKLAVAQPQGEAIKLRKDTTLQKLYRNRAVSYVDGSGDNPKVVQIKPAEVYLNARARATFLDTCFEPQPDKAAAAAIRGEFNLWNGLAAKPVPGDWSLLRDHIRDNICGENEEYFNFLMTWLASLFARPGIKVPSSVAITGEQGTGKSKVFDWVRRAIGSAALKVSSGRHLTGNFNAHLDGLIFLVCEEAFWGGDKQGAGVMKDLISSDTLQIEGKFANLIERPNYVNISFVSNNEWTIPTDKTDARRFFVLVCGDARKEDAVFFGKIDDQMENGGMEAMVHELMHWNPADFGKTWEWLRTPPKTDYLRDQVARGLEGPAARLINCLANGVISGKTNDGDVFYYDLEEDVSTDITRAHAVAALNPDTDRGNRNAQVLDAIRELLGEDADNGDLTKRIAYLGEYQTVHDDKGKAVREGRREKMTENRERYITVPPMRELRGENGVLHQYGQK